MPRLSKTLYLLSLMVLLAISGCGKKGPLYLPESADTENTAATTDEESEKKTSRTPDQQPANAEE